MQTATTPARRMWIAAIIALALAFGARIDARAQESFSATHLAFLDGATEVPAVPDGGQGIAFMRLDPASQSLEYRVSVSLPPNDVITMAHFHRGVKGVSGPPIHTINFAAGSHTATGTWTNLTAEDMQALATGGIYVNVHTERNGSGQVRGQVMMIPNFSTLQLSADQEVPPTGTLGGGNGAYWFDPVAKRLAYQVEWDSLSGPPTMAHFHRGAMGVSGPVVHPIALPDGAGIAGEANGVWENMSEADIADLMAGRLYVNIHTAAHELGEIRGQVLSSEFFTAAVSSANETPASSGSNMMGTGFVVMTGDNKVTGLFIVSGGTGPIAQAHIHAAPVGTPGPVVQPLLGLNDLWVIPFPPTFTAEQQGTLRNSGMYANFHTQQFEQGEARGQLIPAATNLAPPQSSVPGLKPDAPASALAAWYDGASNTIRLRASQSAGSTATLYSPLGEQVRTLSFAADHAAIDAGSLPAGVYFVQLLRNGAPAGFDRVVIVR